MNYRIDEMANQSIPITFDLIRVCWWVKIAEWDRKNTLSDFKWNRKILWIVGYEEWTPLKTLGLRTPIIILEKIANGFVLISPGHTPLVKHVSM